MSFQDVGRKSSNRKVVNARMGAASSSAYNNSNSNSSTSNNSSSVFGSMSALSASTATSQISDSLTQYHRNVGILEKIARSLLSCQTNQTSTLQRDELELQYKAQTDVLRQLESRLKEQILAQRQRLSSQSQTSSQKQALAKLERDFERVQSSVVALRARVTKQQKQYQQRGYNGGGAGSNAAPGSEYSNNAAKTALEQQQLLVQQDRLQEEIMREREEEIRKINKGMHQVNQIYKDLAHIVGEQQEHVDQIEDKMEESKTAAQSGLDQIHKANESYGTNANCSIM
ncbi:unnamed protein product [Pseudo-nitzschia multistriata]|uniref:t-SNARE coiled-coil homology domain-containing protein n=1 Tax=Pseudo-nitzschia multistriata TaxID=183589 RepID=A0A448ZPJ1_9STRA|nr:unnamed protein product [Pseudo-nitzschia multistriata]